MGGNGIKYALLKNHFWHCTYKYELEYTKTTGVGVKTLIKRAMVEAYYPTLVELVFSSTAIQNHIRGCCRSTTFVSQTHSRIPINKKLSFEGQLESLIYPSES